MMIHADTGHHTWPPGATSFTCLSIGETQCPAGAAAGCHDEGVDSAGKSRTALSGQAVMGDLLHIF